MSFEGGASELSSSLSSFGVDSILRLRPRAMSIDSCVPGSANRGSVPFSALISTSLKQKQMTYGNCHITAEVWNYY